jgi:energy-coupling factor transporter ATP-binding protein EcfA2
MNDDLEKVTYFAETDSRGERKPFGIKNFDRSKHVYVIGKTGMGKSTLLENMAIQDIQQGRGLAFVDPHGNTAEKLLEYVPPERVKDVLYFAPFDQDYPISFNIMEDVGVDKRHLVVNGLMSVFEKIWEDAWSARMAYILQNTLLALLEYPGATLLAVNRMYTDKAFRNKVVENVSDISVKSFWVDEYAKYTDKYAQEATPAIQNKIGQFAGNPLIRNIIGQPKSSFDVRKLMDDKKILIVNLSKGKVGEGNARLLGSMLITKIYLAAMSRADESATSLAKLPQFYLFVDEFQSFADKSFADILSEARKYKLNLTIAHQYIEQMEEEVRDAVFGNVGTMITFRVGAYDAEVLEKEFAPVFILEDLVNLGRFQMYLKLMIDSVTSQPFSATALPPIALPTQSYVKEIMENSRQVFARPRTVVEKGIIEWHGEGKAEAGLPAAEKPKVILYPAKKPEPQALDPRPFTPPPPPPPPKPAPKLIPKAPPKVSLESLKNKADNQRKPDVKNVSALRDALTKITSSKPQISNNNQTSIPKPEPKQGPSPDELKKLLGVE